MPERLCRCFWWAEAFGCICSSSSNHTVAWQNKLLTFHSDHSKSKTKHQNAQWMLPVTLKAAGLLVPDGLLCVFQKRQNLRGFSRTTTSVFESEWKNWQRRRKKKPASQQASWWQMSEESWHVLSFWVIVEQIAACYNRDGRRTVTANYGRAAAEDHTGALQAQFTRTHPNLTTEHKIIDKDKLASFWCIPFIMSCLSKPY